MNTEKHLEKNDLEAPTSQVTKSKGITIPKTKRKIYPIMTPKTIIDSKIFLNKVLEKIGIDIYNISINDEEIIFLDDDNKKLSINPVLEDSKFIASLIKMYHNDFDIKYACIEKEIGNPILYIFLLPFVSEKGCYLIKLGYTKDIIQRYKDLKKEFGITEIYLMYACKIGGEHIEINIHNVLQNLFSTSVYRMKKKSKKVDENTISEETYIFTFPLYKNIIQIIYRSYTMVDKAYLIKIENELVINKKELVIKENELKLKEFENESKLKELENEKLKLQNDLKIKELDSQLKFKELENENLRLQIELLKLQNQK